MNNVPQLPGKLENQARRMCEALGIQKATALTLTTICFNDRLDCVPFRRFSSPEEMSGLVTMLLDAGVPVDAYWLKIDYTVLDHRIGLLDLEAHGIEKCLGLYSIAPLERPYGDDKFLVFGGVTCALCQIHMSQKGPECEECVLTHILGEPCWAGEESPYKALANYDNPLLMIALLEQAVERLEGKR